jgi:hypothetical protein
MPNVITILNPAIPPRLYSPPLHSLTISPHSLIETGKECVLSIARDTITAIERKICIIYKDIKDLSQQWKIESAYKRFNF